LRAPDAQLVTDKVFGSITESAVKAFQFANGLKPDGIVGPLTAAALDRVKAVAAEKPLPSSAKIAPHLSAMRSITGCAIRASKPALAGMWRMRRRGVVSHSPARGTALRPELA